MSATQVEAAVVREGVRALTEGRGGIVWQMLSAGQRQAFAAGWLLIYATDGEHLLDPGVMVRLVLEIVSGVGEATKNVTVAFVPMAKGGVS